MSIIQAKVLGWCKIIIFRPWILNFIAWILNQMTLGLKNLPANEGDIRGMGSIPGMGRFPEERHDDLP